MHWVWWHKIYFSDTKYIYRRNNFCNSFSVAFYGKFEMCTLCISYQKLKWMIGFNYYYYLLLLVLIIIYTCCPIQCFMWITLNQIHLSVILFVISSVSLINCICFLVSNYFFGNNRNSSALIMRNIKRTIGRNVVKFADILKLDNTLFEPHKWQTTVVTHNPMKALILEFHCFLWNCLTKGVKYQSMKTFYQPLQREWKCMFIRLI